MVKSGDVIPAGELGPTTPAGPPKERGKDHSLELKTRTDAVQASPDLGGIVPSEELAPPSGVEGSFSHSLMKRAALCLVDNSVREVPRPKDEALAEAGIPMSVYWQMVESLDWKRVYDWAVYEGIVRPRMPEMMLAATKMATAGDERSLKVIREFMAQWDTTAESDYRDRLAALDEAQFTEELRSLHETLTEALRDADMKGEALEASVGVRDAVRKKLAEGEQKPQGPSVETVDHDSLFDEDE